MNFTNAKGELAALSSKVNYSTLLIGALLLIIIILGIDLHSALFKQKTIVTPAVVREPFIVSETGVDNSYLRLMANNFAMERLSVTPDTVEANHKILLQYTDPEFYHGFLDILNSETAAIEKEKISSVFYPTVIVADNKKMAVLIKGDLQRWSTSVPLKSYKKTYLIKFSYRNGNLKILSFSELEDNKKA